MKTEHTVTAPADATLIDLCVAADEVDTGQTLDIVEDGTGDGAGRAQ